MNKFLALVKIELIVFTRDVAAIFWTFLFPFLILLVFMSISPTKKPETETKFLFIEGKNVSIEAINFTALEQAIRKNIKQADIAYVDHDSLPSSFPKNQIRVSFESEVGRATPSLLLSHIKSPSEQITTMVNTLKLLNRYIETTNQPWVEVGEVRVSSVTSGTVGESKKSAQNITIGLICMTIVSTCLFGFSVVLVQLRATNALKIYHILPMNTALYAGAFMLSRVLIIIAFSIIFLSVANALYSLNFVYSLKNIVNFIALVSIGSFTFICIGLLIASRITSVSAANGIINLFYFPLVLLSGLFFPISSDLEWINKLASVLPLSEYADMFRKIMFSNSSFYDHLNTLVLMFIWGAVTFFISQRKFVWNADRG